VRKLKDYQSDRSIKSREYLRKDVVVVFKTKERFGGLSNMAGGYPLCVNDICIFTSEALYQACRFPHLPDVQREIVGQHSPMAAKMKSKSYRRDTRSDWMDIRFKIMRWCLRVKLAQNYEEFGRLLLATKDNPIVEQSRKDIYWGAKESGEAKQMLIGENVLGRLLMELREALKKDLNEELKVVSPMKIPNFFMFGKPIEMVTVKRKSQVNMYQPPLL
jgi:ribA/ribD-fused uncharacterized protein